MKVTLKNLENGSEREFEPSHFPVVIGRGDNASIQIDDRWASRQHCELCLHDGHLFARDLRSKHGTLLNGSPISEGVLQADDVLSIGLTAFAVLVEVAEDVESYQTSS